MHGLVADAGTLERTDGLGEVLAEPVTGRAGVAKRWRAKSAAQGLGSDNPYEILGVRRGASPREVRAAYLGLVKELHPDGRTPDPDADEWLKAINAAYRKLKAGRPAIEGGRWRARTLFAAGMLMSMIPLLAVGSAYYAGLIGFRRASLNVAVVPDGAGAGVGMTNVQKDRVVGLQEAFADAKRLGTREAWAGFLAAHPEGATADLARQAIAAMERQAAFAEANRLGTKEAWAKFLTTYPDGANGAHARQSIAAIERREAAAARKVAERLAWSTAEKGTRAELASFIATYADSEYVGKARRLQADLEAWERAERNGGKAALHQYLAAHPSGRRAAVATERIALLELEERDQEAWLKAQQRHSKAAYAVYLTTYPHGSRAADARTRIAELERSEARAQEAPVQQARVQAEAVKMRPPLAAPADEPFVGADGRIRR